MKIYKILFVFAIGIAFAACTTGNISQTKQVNDASFLYFTTTNENNEDVEYVASIDDGEKFDILVEYIDYKDDSFQPKDYFEITPGKHNIKIYNSSGMKMIYEEDFYISNQETKGVEIR